MSPNGKETLEEFLKKLGQAAAPKSRVQRLFNSAANAAGKGDYETAEQLSTQAGRLTRLSRALEERIAGNLSDIFQQELDKEGLGDFVFPKIKSFAPGETDPDVVKIRPARKRRSLSEISAEKAEQAKRITPSKILEDPITETCLAGRMQRNASRLSQIPPFEQIGYSDPNKLDREMQESLAAIANMRGNQPVSQAESLTAGELTRRAIDHMTSEKPGMTGWTRLTNRKINPDHNSWRILGNAIIRSEPEERALIREILTSPLTFKGNWNNPCGGVSNG